MNKELWNELDDVSEEIRARFEDRAKGFPVHSAIRFAKRFNKGISAGMNAVVVARIGDYYALTVQGNYVEGVHASFLAPSKGRS